MNRTPSRSLEGKIKREKGKIRGECRWCDEALNEIVKGG
jgi:hypothetical protein